jgi:hypothetical protein
MRNHPDYRASDRVVEAVRSVIESGHFTVLS